MTGSSGSGGGDGGMVVAMFVVVSVAVSPVLGQTAVGGSGSGSGNGGDGGGVFQLFTSCGASYNTSHLSVRRSMWVRGAAEEVTLTPVDSSTEPCVLPPYVSHQVTISDQMTVHVWGAAGEEEDKDVCHFHSSPTFVLPKGVLKVSCLKEKRQAEAEMVSVEESSRSVPSRAKPQSRAVDPPPTAHTPLHTPATSPPPSSQAPPVAATTLEPPSTVTRAKGLNTTLTVTSATKNPPLIDGGGLWTTLRHERTPGQDATRWQETTEIPDSTPDGTTISPTPDYSSSSSTSSTSSSTQDTGQAGKTPLLPKAHPPITRKDNISVRTLAAQSGGEEASGDHDDHFIYFAGAGAGVAILVLGVVVVACVVHYRGRKVKKMDASDLFMSGGYRGSLNSMDMSGSQGAYLNAHVMYSGAEPEFAESFELEERILNSNVSYSTHSIPKCLKES